jgi:hypothetical protein
MILVANTEMNLQRQINRAKKFFDFANIKVNLSKCEVLSINASKTDQGIIIDEVQKEYIEENEFIKDLGVPLGSTNFFADCLEVMKKKNLDIQECG